MKKLRNFPMWKPWPPWVEASDSCTPNQTSMMVASAMHMRTPKASIVGDAVAVSASHPFVIQFSTPIHHLARVQRRSISQGFFAPVVGPRNVCLIGASVVRSVLESPLLCVLLLFLCNSLLNGMIGVD